MKLDPTVMRTMDGKDFKVLEAVEKGMRNHALVPLPLVLSIANLRHGGANKIVSSLLRDKLLSHERKGTGDSYDGYRLTNAGYDILALYNLKTRGLVAALGDRIGTGKESDIYLAVSPSGKQVVLKFHRLGRTSFRNIKKKRDYDYYYARGHGRARNQGQPRQTPNSWLFLSRISALKEFAFMKALHQVEYPTPTPIAHSRHVVVMSLVRGIPLYQMRSREVTAEQAQSIWEQAAALATRLAQHGLVHCDLNEFNLMVDLSGGIQNAHEHEDDPYVRHSGMSVATPGALSTPVWQQHEHEDCGDSNSEEKAAEFLENGDAKPIVTLIDFPQMVSSNHPNAKELYDRDLACLKKFFQGKLHCNCDEEDLIAWDDVLQRQQDEKDEDGEESTACLASKAQLRLDQELKASGYSAEDSNRDLELYYYETELPNLNNEQVQEEPDVDERSSGSQGEEDAEGTNEERGSKEESQQDLTTRENSEDGNVVIDLSEKRRLARADLEEKARARVRQQLEDQKRRGRQKGAFRKGNSNKTYVKGKRVLNDAGF